MVIQNVSEQNNSKQITESFKIQMISKRKN